MHAAGLDRQSDRAVAYPIAAQAGKFLGDRHMLGEVIIVERGDVFRGLVDSDNCGHEHPPRAAHLQVAPCEPQSRAKAS